MTERMRRIDRDSVRRNPRAGETMTRFAGRVWHETTVMVTYTEGGMHWRRQTEIIHGRVSGYKDSATPVLPGGDDRLPPEVKFERQRRQDFQTLYHSPLPHFNYSLLPPIGPCEECGVEFDFSKAEQLDTDLESYSVTSYECPHCKTWNEELPCEQLTHEELAELADKNAALLTATT